MLRANHTIEPFVSKLLPAYGRQFFKAFLADQELDSWHVFGTRDRSGYIHSLARSIFEAHCGSTGKVLADPTRTTFLTDRVYHLDKLELPCKLDVGLAVTDIRSFDFRLDIGIFPTTSDHPYILVKLEQAFIDKHQRIIRVPEQAKHSLNTLLSKNVYHKDTFRYCLYFNLSFPSSARMNSDQIAQQVEDFKQVTYSIASSASSAFFTGFDYLTEKLDAEITNFLGQKNTQFASVCPKCKSDIGAPLGARVRCESCAFEFNMNSAAGQLSKTVDEMTTSNSSLMQSQEESASFPGTITRAPLVDK
jgi:hypothetical protein